MKLEINIGEQEEKLKERLREIAERRGEIQEIATQLAKEEQNLVNEGLKKQGALDLIKSLDE